MVLEQVLQTDKRLDMKDFLSRTDLGDSLWGLLTQISVVYGLGDIVDYKPIDSGYEELNIKTTTDKGCYVIKIFAKGKSFRTIQNYIKGLTEFAEAGIPVPHLLKENGSFIYETKGKNGSLYLCVMEYFEGLTFNEFRPMSEDFINLTTYIARIHKLLFHVTRNYDSWGTVNLAVEFKDKKDYLTSSELHLIAPIVGRFQQIDYSNFSRCIIHGDLQKTNLMKNSLGNYCILDLGCMDYSFAVIDLAIFMALSCFDLESAKKDREIYELVIAKYLQRNTLCHEELNTLPLLVQATYAIYTIASRYRLTAKQDISLQTQNWLNFGRKGLIRSDEIWSF